MWLGSFIGDIDHLNVKLMQFSVRMRLRARSLHSHISAMSFVSVYVYVRGGHENANFPNFETALFFG